MKASNTRNEAIELQTPNTRDEGIESRTPNTRDEMILSISNLRYFVTRKSLLPFKGRMQSGSVQSLLAPPSEGAPKVCTSPESAAFQARRRTDSSFKSRPTIHLFQGFGSAATSLTRGVCIQGKKPRGKTEGFSCEEKGTKDERKRK
jgi:hypothetical protein